MSSMPPEALLEAYPEPMRVIADRLRDAVKHVIPDVVERVRPGWHLIGYDVPVAAGRAKYFAYIAPESGHVHLGFEYGVAMDDPDGHLQGAGITRQVRWLTMRRPEDIRDDVVERFILEGARVAMMSRDERMLRALANDEAAGEADRAISA
jgi:hypothetical protein